MHGNVLLKDEDIGFHIYSSRCSGKRHCNSSGFHGFQDFDDSLKHKMRYNKKVGLQLIFIKEVQGLNVAESCVCSLAARIAQQNLHPTFTHRIKVEGHLNQSLKLHSAKTSFTTRNWGKFITVQCFRLIFLKSLWRGKFFCLSFYSLRDAVDLNFCL